LFTGLLNIVAADRGRACAIASAEAGAGSIIRTVAVFRELPNIVAADRGRACAVGLAETRAGIIVGAVAFFETFFHIIAAYGLACAVGLAGTGTNSVVSAVALFSAFLNIIAAESTCAIALAESRTSAIISAITLFSAFDYVVAASWRDACAIRLAEAAIAWSIIKVALFDTSEQNTVSAYVPSAVVLARVIVVGIAVIALFARIHDTVAASSGAVRIAGACVRARAFNKTASAVWQACLVIFYGSAAGAFWNKVATGGSQTAEVPYIIAAITVPATAPTATRNPASSFQVVAARASEYIICAVLV
jgi:hypothetical protein